MQEQSFPVIEWIEATLEISLGAEARSADLPMAALWQELIPRAIRRTIPWLQTLSVREQRMVETLLATYLVREHQELPSLSDGGTGAPSGVGDDLADFYSEEDGSHLWAVWRTCFSPKQDLAGIAAYAVHLLRHGRMIYHLLLRPQWVAAQSAGIYTPESLTKEGFIHCSNIDQVVRSADAYFKGQRDLLLLGIAAGLVQAEIRDEDLLGEGLFFPHIYGQLNLNAVISTMSIEQRMDGKFQLPAGLSMLSEEDLSP